MSKKVSRTYTLAAKVVLASFEVLRENGGQMAGRRVMQEVEKRVELNDWETAVYEKTGNTRWQSILHFFSIDCVKAGYIIKKNGVWYLTPEGEDAMSKGAKGLLDSATEKYREWKKKKDAESSSDPANSQEEDTAIEQRGITFQEAEELAVESLRKSIAKMNPYEFQEFCAALLRGMGYFTPFIAPKGKDGGIDIVAYRDPFGCQSPRIKIQVKHRDIQAGVQEIRQLVGVLQKDGDVGIFISSGGFSADAKVAARDSHIHVDLIDFERLIQLWQDFYPKLSDEDKALLPIVPVYFLAPE